ncbi:MAG: MBL fold metallo-hydrolase [Candidatus Schekmanbacteria bacterium]|nr:MBL fold metallo-hydrolase [Candidatus Schekmanbacteria bacterium]
MRKLLILLCCFFMACSSEIIAQNTPTAQPAATGTKPVMAKGTNTGSPRITFLYGDRELLVKTCQPAWGLVILLEYDGRRILFNAGGDENVLRNNMEALKIDPQSLDAVVISHHHWEMVDGIGYLLRAKPSLPVYTTEVVAEGLGKGEWAQNFINVPDLIALTPNILVMSLQSPRFEGGPMGLQEVHIIVKTKDGLVILQGCGHPRIVNIMKKSIESTGEKRVWLIAGGTRLLRPGKAVKMPDGRVENIPQMTYYRDEDYRKIADELLAAGVQKIIPTHCTLDAEPILKEKFGDKYIYQTLGMTLEIPAPAGN